MIRFRDERGQINAGCFIAVIVLAIAVVIAVKTVPVLVNMGDLQKEIELLAERATLSTYTNKLIKGRILQKAEALHLQVAPENIVVKRNSQFIDITVTYDIEIHYPLYTYHWHKVHQVTGRLF
jgi:hypothetical protein